MPYLVLLSGTAKGKAVRLENRPITVGRHRSCELCIQLRQISRRHCKLSPTADGQWVVTDLGTQNGTKVNGDKVVEKRLGDGDEIQISTVRIRFRDEREATAPKEDPKASPPAQPEDDEPEPTIGMDSDFELAEGIQAEEVVPAGPPAGGGIRFGVGLAAQGGGAAVANAEGTGIENMEDILGADAEVEGTEFVDIKDLLVAEPGAGRSDASVANAKAALIGIIGVLVVALVGILLYKKLNPPPKVDRWKRANIEVGTRTVYPVPEFANLENKNSKVITAIPSDTRKELTLIGLREGRAVIRLKLKGKDGTISYVEMPFDVVRPLQDVICAQIREEHQNKTPAEQTRVAKKHFGDALNYYESRNNHRKNLYYAHEAVQKAWCLLEHLGRSKVRHEAKELLDKTKEELKIEYDKSAVQVGRFIRLKMWRDLGIELEKVMQLLPDSRDPRHQRARNLRSRYQDEIQVDTQRGENPR